MTWSWPNNLQIIHNRLVGCYPGLIIYGIGDTAHLNESGGSDHNADDVDLVHAGDGMTQAYERKHNLPADSVGKQVVAFLLRPDVRVSLQYVIHDRTIWSVTTDWEPRPYHGTDPHVDHVHWSGKHGSHHGNVHTGTGYDLAAEAMTPPGSPCTPEDEMTPADWKTLGAMLDTKLMTLKAEILVEVGAEVFGFDPNVAGKGGIPTPAYQPDAKTNPTCSLGWMLGEINTNAHKAANPTTPPVTP